ncbi:MAG: hypothetical protein ABIJ40_05380 [Bacteroidota bacterium]
MTVTSSAVTFSINSSAMLSSSLVASYFVFGESLSGTKNGTNRIFTLAYTPITNSETIIFAGTVLERTVDYTISGVTVTLSASIPAPTSGEMLKINYIKQ